MSDQSDKLTYLRRATKRPKRGVAQNRSEDGSYCSFCGKEESEVKRLFSGPSVLICNECIVECNRILDT